MANWIKFIPVDLKDGRKTLVWAVMTTDGRDCLGRIGWYSPWRKYCFVPAADTVFEQDCLREIATFGERATEGWKLARKALADSARTEQDAERKL